MQEKLTADYVFVWDQWVVWRLGGRPPLAGLIVALILFASFLLPISIWGEFAPSGDGNEALTPVSLTWAAFVTSFLGGYAIAVASFALVNDARDMRALAPIIGAEPDAFIEEWHDIQASNTKRGRIYSLCGWAVGMIVMFVAVPGASDLVMGKPADTYSAVALGWFLLVVPVVISLVAKGIFYSWIEERFGRDVRGRGLEVDLFNLEKLAPLTRMALRRSFIWIVGATIGSLYFLSSDLDRVLFAPFFVGIAGIAGVTLFMPLYNAHRSIRDMKMKELGRIRAAIMRARDAAFGNGDDAEKAVARLPGLIALEARVDDTREWPVDISTAGRFSLYLAIPLGSWLGGALMERIVDSVI